MVPINGDVSLPELGLSVIDRDILKSRVSIVFHVAARIKFDRNIKEAVDINVKGTRRVLELCHQLPILEVTGFVFCIITEIMLGSLGFGVRLDCIRASG